MPKPGPKGPTGPKKRTRKRICDICQEEFLTFADGRQRICLKKECKRKNNHAWRIFREYGVTREDYNRVLEEQDFSCKICRKKTEQETLHVDHDHTTMKFRGLLCGNCNRAIGLFKDDPALLHAAIAYLLPDFKIMYLKNED
jgi:hypothetical protein